MKLCMFVLDNCNRDSRVLKEAETLAHAGHDVRIIALLDDDAQPYEERDGFRIIRVIRNPIHHRLLKAMSKARSLVGASLSQLLSLAPHNARPPSDLSLRQAEQTPASGPTGAGRLTARGHRHVRRILYWALRAAITPINRPLIVLDYYWRSWQAIKDEQAHVFHAHDLTALPAGYLAKRKTGGKLVYDSHELFTTLHYIPRTERAILRLLERYLIRRASAVVTVNEFVAEELAQRYQISLPVVVRNCPPTGRQGDDERGNSLRETLGLDDTVPIIVHVGIFSMARGCDKLIEAARFLDRAVIVFLGWGAGTEEADLKELVRQSHLETRVLFVPPVAPEQVVEHISSAQVGVVLFRNVSLNHYHATPNKLWQYINAGLPVVSSNFPAIKAIVEGYRLGCTCDPEYPRDIANAINYVLSDKSRYEEMKRKALEAAKTFNWENESRKLLDVYRRLSEAPHD